MTLAPSDGGSTGLTLALSVEDVRWDSALERADVVVEETLHHAARHLKILDAVATEVSVTLTDDKAVHEINCQWRDKDGPTNVLSFPMQALEPGDRPGPLLGDLVLAFETCAREAGDEGKPFVNHARHLLVHGFLHCLGYDHMDEGEAEEMEDLERAILAGMGIPDPYDIADGGPSGDNRVQDETPL
ncbi:rRNA maturation RNase YbeY [Fulvimarina sp. 2208YS6-2-32]|nr:rRNA maturation RNase YbeY [Fulvimarina sp. 2208YS6-2-32]